MTRTTRTAEGLPGGPRKRKSGKNRVKQTSWRPRPVLLGEIDTWRFVQEKEDGVPWCRAAAIGHLVAVGLEARPYADTVPRSTADAIEAKLDTISAQLDELTHHARTLSRLMDALGPVCLAGPRIIAAWMAADRGHQERDETPALVEERILDALGDASQQAWSAFAEALGPEPEAPRQEPTEWPHAGLVLRRYLLQDRASPTKRVEWLVDGRLLGRLDAWTTAQGVSRARAVSALVALGLDIAQGNQSVPAHRAALLEDAVAGAQESLAGLTDTLRFLRGRIDALGAKVCGVPELLVRWQAQDPDFVLPQEASQVRYLSPEEREATLLESYWQQAERDWQAFVDRVVELPEAEPVDDEGDD